MATCIQRLALLAVTFALSACIRGGGLWQQDKSSLGTAATVKSFTNDDGAVVGKFAAGSTQAQSLTVDSGDLSGTALAIDAGGINGGSLSVSISTGSSLANSSVLSATGVTGATSVTSASNSVSVSSDMVANASGSLSIPVTSTTLNLDAASDALLCVLYVVTDASLPEGARNVVGILGRDEITVADGKVTFRFKSFGTYHVVRTNTVVKKGAKQVSDAVKPLTAKAAKALPEIKFETIAHDLDGNKRHHLKTNVSGSLAKICRFLILPEINAAACFSVPGKVSGQTISFDDDGQDKGDEKGDACMDNKSQSKKKQFFVQTECLFADSRTGKSDASGPYQDEDGGSDGGLEITNVPPNSFVPYNNLGDWPVEGTCKNSGTVVVSVRTVTQQVSCGTNNGRWSARLDLSTVPSGDQKLVAQLLDYRNVVSSERSVAVKIDRSQPTATISSGATAAGFTSADARNWNAFPLSGSCSESGRPVKIAFGTMAGPPVAQFDASCNAGSWVASPNVTTLRPDNYMVAAGQLSPAGRPGFSSPLPVTVGAPLYGTGLDGNVTLDALALANYDLVNLQNTVPANIFKYARNTGSLDCDGGLGTGVCRFSFASAVFTGAADLTAGAELMWIVHASKGGDTSRNCPSAVGTYGFGRVLSYNGGSYTVDIARTTSSSPPTFSTPISSDQCVVQVIRVPNIVNFTVKPMTSTGTAVATTQFNWDYGIATGEAGVIALRVAGVMSVLNSVGGPATENLSFNMTGKGYKPGNLANYQGSSEDGPGGYNLSANNGAGGGCGNAYGGGGGAGYDNGGNGNGITNKGLKRSVLADASFSYGLPTRLYLGGSGGSTSDSNYAASNGGGFGGGILLFFAKIISNVGTGAFDIIANGANSPAAGLYSAGGGGGGSIITYIHDLQRGAALSSAGGFAAIPGSMRGGGGGGGYLHSTICNGAGSATMDYSGGAGFQAGLTGKTTSSTSSCN